MPKQAGVEQYGVRRFRQRLSMSAPDMMRGRDARRCGEGLGAVRLLGDLGVRFYSDRLTITIVIHYITKTN